MLGMRTVGPSESIVVFRMGNTGPEHVHGPGRMFYIPFIDRPILVDRRERRFGPVEVAATTNTGERVAATITVVARVVDPLRNVVNVADYDSAVSSLLGTVFGEQVGQLTAADEVDDRALENLVRPRLEEILENWGSECTSLEVRLTVRTV